MAANTTTPFVLAAARAAMEGRSDKGQRPEAALAFLNADSHAAREVAVAEFGAGFVRRGLREQAVFNGGEPEVANAFWLLRDSIDHDGTVTDEIFSDETELVEVV
jgi:hypothetical protein